MERVQMPTELVPAVAVARELNVTRRTVNTWSRDPKIGFPPESRINKRVYFNRADIEAWKLSRQSRKRQTP